MCWVCSIKFNWTSPLHKQYISRQPFISHTYNLNVRQDIQSTVVKRMRSRALG